MADDPERGAPHLNLPSPDPSTITTAAIREAVASSKAVTEAELHAVLVRVDAMDKAADVLSENVNRVPTLLDRQIAQIKELFGEKFESIQKQFDERDARTEQAAITTKIAVDAALQAQKEAANAQNVSNTAAITK